MESIVSDETSSLSDAFQKLSKFEKVNFDETVEVSCSMGVDPKQSSQGVRGTVNLPHGSGKDVRVIVFTDNSDDAKAAGADHAGLDGFRCGYINYRRNEKCAQYSSCSWSARINADP